MTSPTPGSPTPTADPATLHVVVGPDEHGVVLHGELVGHACGDWVLRLPAPRPLTDDELGTARVVHVPWTDRLFGRRAEQALAAFAALTEPVLQRGLSLSVTLHDLPVGDSALEQRRRTAYRGVVAHATGVVVSSWRELELAQELSVTARSLRCIPLPVPSSMTDAVEDATRRADATAGDRPSDVTVLGFVFPDRGYEHTIAELPTGVDLVALGRPSEGHDDLPEQLAELAARTGHLMRTTGFVADADLPGALRAAGVPVAPNRRVAASGSIAAWVGAGRRPLVPDTAYARELAARWPGALRLYDADAPGALRREIEATVVDPSLTWLPPGTRTGPDTREVARAYATHLAACLPPAALPLGGDRWVVPDNRWDLLDGRRPDTAPTVSVVVPHHEAQADLDLVLTALTLQDHPATRLQVVVADDGSRVLPDTRAAGGLDVRVVRQQRAGFRAAAARNLGAAAAEGHVVAFLDGDTVPEPGYLRALTRLPALLPDALTVGRRRHADLGGWSPARLRAWLTRGGPPPRELTEPTWLRDGYREHRDLLDVDSRSHRYVISAVMALHRDLLTELGGFDERFSSYGGGLAAGPSGVCGGSGPRPRPRRRGLARRARVGRARERPGGGAGGEEPRDPGPRRALARPEGPRRWAVGPAGPRRRARVRRPGRGPRHEPCGPVRRHRRGHLGRPPRRSGHRGPARRPTRHRGRASARRAGRGAGGAVPRRPGAGDRSERARRADCGPRRGRSAHGAARVEPVHPPHQALGRSARAGRARPVGPALRCGGPGGPAPQPTGRPGPRARGAPPWGRVDAALRTCVRACRGRGRGPAGRRCGHRRW